MAVTEAAESTSEKGEEQDAVEEQAVVSAPVKLHDLSVCPLFLGSQALFLNALVRRRKTSPY